MSGFILRIQKDENYSVISNEPLNDDRLSWEARGVMGYLLTKPNNWIARNYDLEKQGKIGGYKMSRILKELKQAGYLSRIRYKKPDGTFEWETIVHEKSTIPRLPIDGSPIDGSPINGKPRDIVNTESLNTNLINTKKYISATKVAAKNSETKADQKQCASIFSFEGEEDTEPVIPEKPLTVKPKGRRGAKAEKEEYDPLLKDQRIKIVGSILHATPTRGEQRELIKKEISDMKKWEDTLRDWAQRGWSPKNVKGMVEVYQKGGPSSIGKNGNGYHNQPTKDPVAAEEY